MHSSPRLRRPPHPAEVVASSLATAGLCLMLASCAPNSEFESTTASLAPASAAPAEPAATPAAQPRVAAAAITSPKSDSGAAPTAASAAERVRRLAEEIAADLAQRCPMRDPGDQSGLDACKKAMFTGSKLRASLAPITIWGRTHKDPDKPLKDTNLTQFGPDVLTGMYLPLFMFTGKHNVTYSTSEKLYRIELAARFRNRLPPGQFPYPFWHEDEKWKTYETANAILLWVDPKQMTIRFAQFTPRGTLYPAAANAAVAQAPFDGRWMWTDASGQQQPKVTLFDGLFRADNPHLKKLDASYRELALSLREGQCMSCHVPNNPYKSKRLVLLQTPAHAASEIKRVMATVRRGSMPINETTAAPEELEGKLKGVLLQRASTFEKVVDAAKAWEAANNPAAKGTPVAAPTAPRKAAAATPVQ